MIRPQAVLRCIDNSGARFVKCIRVLGKKGPRTSARLGDKISVAVKVANPSKPKIKKGQLKTAIIVRDARNIRRKDGIHFRFAESACVLIHKSGRHKDQPVGRIIHGPVCRELRNIGFMKIISLASLAL